MPFSWLFHLAYEWLGFSSQLRPCELILFLPSFYIFVALFCSPKLGVRIIAITLAIFLSIGFVGNFCWLSLSNYESCFSHCLRRSYLFQQNKHTWVLTRGTTLFENLLKQRRCLLFIFAMNTRIAQNESK